MPARMKCVKTYTKYSSINAQAANDKLTELRSKRGSIADSTIFNVIMTFLGFGKGAVGPTASISSLLIGQRHLLTTEDELIEFLTDVVQYAYRYGLKSVRIKQKFKTYQIGGTVRVKNKVYFDMPVGVPEIDK